MGFDYGPFPAHNSLWDMAERTKGDILARIGLGPQNHGGARFRCLTWREEQIDQRR